MEAPDERRIKLELQYDGADFLGWQVQPGSRTVQEELEAALSRVLDRPTRVVGAGRTDRGVHATGQVASALVPAKWTPDALLRALNALLPQDLRVVAVEDVAADFHARYSATARGYVYRVGTTPAAESPFRRRWCWPLSGRLARDAAEGRPLDAAVLDSAAAALRGSHSFHAFARAGQEERGDRCTVHRAEWSPWSAGLQLTIVADRFLHHMVRYLVGTMLDLARGRRPAAELDALLAGDDAFVTSPPAPPEGLFLVRVYYPGDELNLEEPLDEDLP